MYNEDVTRIPKTSDELWEVLWEQFEYVVHVLYDLPVETEEQALAHVGNPRETSSERGAMAMIRFRGTRADFDQRQYYLEMGRELLPYIHQAIDERKLTRRFVQQWGKIMFCHGYIASFVFDDVDEFAHRRGALKGAQIRSKYTQRKWLSHLFVGLIDRERTTRKDATARIEAYVKDLIAKGRYPEGFAAVWFKPIITKGGLAATYDEKHLALKKMRKLILEPTDDIPPVPSQIP